MRLNKSLRNSLVVDLTTKITKERRDSLAVKVRDLNQKFFDMYVAPLQNTIKEKLTEEEIESSFNRGSGTQLRVIDNSDNSRSSDLLYVPNVYVNTHYGFSSVSGKTDCITTDEEVLRVGPLLKTYAAIEEGNPLYDDGLKLSEEITAYVDFVKQTAADVVTIIKSCNTVNQLTKVLPMAAEFIVKPDKIGENPELCEVLERLNSK